MEASLKNYRQSPRKVRVAANAIKGKRVPEALTILQFMVKRASDPLAKLVASAAANASHNFGVPIDMLVIKSLTVNKGVVLKRIMPRARGSASRINKRSSHVKLVLADVRGATAPKAKEEKSKEVKKAKAPVEASKPVKKAAPKKAKPTK